MSFMSAATAIGFTGVGATIASGVMMGGATTIGMNLIRGNDPFDNIGQGLLLGGIGAGIFGSGGFDLLGSGAPALAEGAVGVGASSTGAGFDAFGNIIPIKDIASTGSSVADLVTKYAPDTLAGMPPDPYGLIPPPVPAQPYIPTEAYWSRTADASGNMGALSDIPPAEAGTVGAETIEAGTLKPSTGEVGFKQSKSGIAGTQPIDFLNNPPSATSITNPNIDYGVNAKTESPFAKFSAPGVPQTQKPKTALDWITAKENRLPVMLGGAGIATLLSSPKQGINTPPRTYQTASTTYRPPQFTTDAYGRVVAIPGSQGYGPMNRTTFTAAQGGGIKAMRSGGETASYIPLETRRGERPVKLYSPEDSEAYKNYEKTDINENEEKDQEKIDKNIAAWLKIHSGNQKESTKNLAEGGFVNYPQYQMSDVSSSPLFQQNIGGGMPNYMDNGMQGGLDITSYINKINAGVQPPPPITQAPVYNSSATNVYDPATQKYITNPNYVTPIAPVGNVDNDISNDSSGSDSGTWSDKAGGPIKAKKYAMGGLAALPEYAAGGRLLNDTGNNPGKLHDGMSDDIPAVIKGERPQRAALADGEFVIPADVVSHLGNGSTKAGGKRLYEMMARIRKARTGNPKQGKQINPMKFMPT